MSVYYTPNCGIIRVGFLLILEFISEFFLLDVLGYVKWSSERGQDAMVKRIQNALKKRADKLYLRLLIEPTLTEEFLFDSRDTQSVFNVGQPSVCPR